MAYVYKKVKKNILFGKNPGEKFLLAMATEGKVDTEMLCEFIMRNSTISEQDVKILMRSLTEVISENIEMGRGVNLEELGVFSPNFKTKGEYDLEKVSVDNIQQVVVNFRPAAKFRKEMDNAPVKETSRFNLKHE